MNTSLTYRGYGIEKTANNKDVIDMLRDELTVSPSYNFNDNTTPKTYTLYLESDNKIYIPRFYGLQKFGLPKTNKVNYGMDCLNFNFKGVLREQQKEPINNFLKAARDPLKMGGIISVPCGFGKTIMSIYIMCEIKKKTLFISHKDFLNEQFKNSVKLFMPDISFGIIKQSKVDIRNKDIVIASLQSLAMRDYDKNIFNEFGLVIIDECHHISSEVFSRALKKMNIPIILGLSATLNRKDGLRKVFEWYIGKSVYTFKKEITDVDMIVHIHKYFETNREYSEIKQLYNGKFNQAGMINNICNYEPRTKYIIEIIKNILLTDTDRKILILSERRNHLNVIENLIIENKINVSIGYYVGGMAMKDLDISSNKQIILATYQMSSEGLNIPTLNTIILASPISDITQSIGRVLREKKEERKYIPLCIDIWDEFSIFKNKGYKRIKFYNNNNYLIQYYTDNELITFNNNVKCNFIKDDDDNNDKKKNKILFIEDNDDEDIKDIKKDIDNKNKENKKNLFIDDD